MAGVYAYTPTVLPPLLGAVLLVAIGLYSWLRRATPGARWLAAGSFIGCLVALGAALQAAAVLPAVKIAWHSFQAAFLLPSAAATTCFALAYTFGGRWVTCRNLALLWTPVLLGLLLILATLGETLGPAQVTSGGTVDRTASDFSRVLLAYAVGLFLVNTAAFLWLFAHSPQHRWPVTLMLVAQLVGHGAFALNIVSPNSPVSFNPVAGSLLLIWTTYAIALFGFRIFDPLPAARRAVFEQMHAGVVVFDPAGRVLNLNPAAEELLGMTGSKARGKTWQQIMPQGEPLLPALSAADTDELPDVTLGHGGVARRYAPALSALRDFRGVLIGYLLLLHDVTEQHRAHAQALEQQRVMATLHERERMARELHDSLGQVLSYTSLQVETAAQLALSGQGEAAAAQLARLGNVVREGHADLREHILNLASTASLARSFVSGLKQYLDGFTRSYNIRTQLDVERDLAEKTIGPETRLQLLRIVQEALSNARRHGQARQVRVTLTTADTFLRLSVEDDGCGFDVRPTGNGDGQHYGLSFMRERAEEMGGAFEVTSAPGRGTRVALEIPVDGGARAEEGRAR